MKKKFLLFAALIGVLVLASCSGGSKKQVASATQEELDNASQVVHYYHISLAALKDVAREKEINAVLGYMEQGGKAPAIPTIVPPQISAKDTALLMHPGEYFNEPTRQNLVRNFNGLFQARNQFYATFDDFLFKVKSKKFAEANALLNTSYKLSIQMTEYKQNVFDILSPFTEQAEKLLLADEPMKDQMIAVRKMAANMQSILDLYARPHVMDGIRLNLRMEELRKELEAAKKLPAVAGHAEEVKSYHIFLTNVESFLKDMQQAIGKGNYNAEVYDAMISQYGISII